MATNLEKIKAEIAQMSAEEFAEFYLNANDMCDRISSCRTVGNCGTCMVKWLNEESEEKEWFI